VEPRCGSSANPLRHIGTIHDKEINGIPAVFGLDFLPSALNHLMHVHPHAAPRFPFVATVGIKDCTDVRPAGITDLSIAGAYFAMPNPFSTGASIFVKIRTAIEFFQCRATVAHSTEGVGMTVMFHNVSPPFLLVLQGWIWDGMHGTSD